MRNRNIHGHSKGVVSKFTDKIGALDKSVKLRRMEPYADVIDEVFSRHKTDDNERTMMFKLVREPVVGTTTRRIHTDNVSHIAGEIADGFDWLNSDITRVMGKYHDIGHTFLGHSGEWWLSSMKDTYGMPNYVHNAIGARNLQYRYNVQDEVEKAILDKEPNISPRKLAKIKRDLWLIIDGINCHNGEKSEYSYAPDFSKTRKRSISEIMSCFVKKGFDRGLIPATAEGSLMRLCDKISYIPFDMVDSFRNGVNIESATIGTGDNAEEHNFYEEYETAFKAMGMPEGSLQRLLNCKTNEEYDAFAYEMQEIFVADVKKNTRRNNIRMSPEMSKVMHGIRDINNKMMVNYTVMREDHEVYVPAMEQLMKEYGKILLDTRLIAPENISDSPIRDLATNTKYKKRLEKMYESDSGAKGFLKYIEETTPEDFDFTVEATKLAFEETINGELDIAQSVALGKFGSADIHAVGDKKTRIDTYIGEFNRYLEVAQDEGVFNPNGKDPINLLKKKIWLEKTKGRIKIQAMGTDKTISAAAGTTPFAEMVAMEMGAQYLANLNDREWVTLLEETKMITAEQKTSLKRKYSEFDFRAEHKKHATWDNIEKLQAQDMERDRLREARGKSFIERAKRFVGFGRDD